MQSFFTRRFEEEVLISEKLRTKILAGMFLFGTLYTAVIIFFLNSSVPDELKHGAALRIFLFLLSLSFLELLTMFYISRLIKRNVQKIPAIRQYLNAAVEITAPSVIMLLLANHVHPDKILHSPTIYICFLFIILSTLRLNYRISLFMGLLAAIEFVTVSRMLITGLEGIAPVDVIQTEHFAAAGKGMLLLLSGIGAAFVARQIKLSVDRSLKVAEQGNKIINLFGQQVSKEVVDEMIDKDGGVQTKLMRVCIMFIDIRNFTSYVADKSPVEIVAYQNAFFKIIVRSVIKYNGIINQFLGDGCMVTFGAPLSLQNPSEHAIRAALEIKQSLNTEIGKGNLPLTNIGIGIHEGDAVTGNIGPVERQQYSITGSVVILAARIEQLNKEYNSQILVSEAVMEQVRTNMDSSTEYIGKVVLKGWVNPIGIYKVA